MIDSTIVLVLLSVSYMCDAYTVQCPHISQWNYSEKSFRCPKDNRYLCLFNIVLDKIEETCRADEEKTRPGFKYVLSPRPDVAECSPDYYQPIIFSSHGNSECTFKKSQCNEEGQVEATNGSLTTDRTCRCDYTKNYDYVTPPNDVCSCVPSEEDCSCYHRLCTGDNEIMISDYKCVSSHNKPKSWQMRCKAIITSSLPTTATTTSFTTSFKQFSETRVSAIEASLLILLFVALFVILVMVLCVNVKPHATIIEVVYRKDLIVTEQCGKNITVIEGERLELQCKFKSILLVNSTTWQHRKLDGKIQHVNSDTDQTSSVTSPLTIDKLKCSHSGRYECILTNRIGLSNTIYNCCPSFLGNLYACGQDDSNYVDINVCSLPDTYQTVSVSKGQHGILEINNQNYTRVMWFKHDGKIASIDPIDRYNMENMENKTSLTIKAADFKDVGIYVGVLVDRQGNVESVGFKFRVKPQEDIYNKMEEHRIDETYVKTADVDKAMNCLQKHGTVVITGRIGTGKSTLCLELASLCEERDYLPFKLDLPNPVLEDFRYSKILCIIDCNEYKSQDPDQMKTLLRDLGNQENVWMVLTCSSTEFTSIQRILQKSNIINEENVIDINASLTLEEKKKILNIHMEANTIAESSSAESNFKGKEMLQNNEIQVKIDTETIGEIVQTEPLHGFPQTAANFCKDRWLLHLGKTYFTNLPLSLEVEIYRLSHVTDTIQATSYEKTYLNANMKYYVLAYIATDEKKCLDKRLINTERFRDLHQSLCGTFISDIDINPMIINAIRYLEGRFIVEEGEKYVFIHPDILGTIYASHEYFTEYLIMDGSFKEIKKFIRSSKYNSEEREIVCKPDTVKYKYLCSRLFTDASLYENIIQDIGMYIYDQFIKLKDGAFRSDLISLLEFNFYTDGNLTKSICKGFQNSFRKPVAKDQRGDIGGKGMKHKISFWQAVLLMNELTDHGKDPWVLSPVPEKKQYGEQREHSLEYGIPISDNVLLCGLITTCFEMEQNGKCKEILKLYFQRRLQQNELPETLKLRVDIYGNTFFHYLVIMSEEESCQILQVDHKLLSGANRKIFGQSNKMNLTPLHMAAYLGKLKLFTLLLGQTDIIGIEKNQQRFLELTEEGRILRYHSTKTTAKDQRDKMGLNFEEGVVRYIQYGTEKDFLDILDLHKRTNLKKKDVRKLYIK